MTESEVYKKHIAPWCKQNGIFVQRIESPSVPDVYMAKNNSALWGEIKCVNSRQKIVKPAWRPGQLAWIRSNDTYGNDNVCLILWYCGEVYWMYPKETYKEEDLVCRKLHCLARWNRTA